jgi:cytochrome c biogenesis factor
MTFQFGVADMVEHDHTLVSCWPKAQPAWFGHALSMLIWLLFWENAAPPTGSAAK